jgi:hypothetical protein
MSYAADEMRHYAQMDAEDSLERAIEGKESELWTDFADPTKFAAGIEETLEGLEWDEIRDALAVCGDYLQDHECRNTRADLIESKIRDLIETAIKRRATKDVAKADKEMRDHDSNMPDRADFISDRESRAWEQFQMREPEYF